MFEREEIHAAAATIEERRAKRESHERERSFKITETRCELFASRLSFTSRRRENLPWLFHVPTDICITVNAYRAKIPPSNLHRVYLYAQKYYRFARNSNLVSISANFASEKLQTRTKQIRTGITGSFESLRVNCRTKRQR